MDLMLQRIGRDDHYALHNNFVDTQKTTTIQATPR